jgi:mono/diheme cytochrome c family protein
MKRALKIILSLVGVAVVVLGGFVAWCAIDGIPHYKRPTLDVKVEVTPARVARGKQLVNLLCAECHKDPTTGKLTGKLMEDAPPQFGAIFSRNITQHPERGIGAWSDGEIVVLLRTGIARDGRYTPPWMAKLHHASDEDINSIVAFLHSSDPLVQPSDVVNRQCQPSLLAKILTHVVWKPLAMPTAPIQPPDKKDKVAYGRYLIAELECYACHSADFKTMNVEHPEQSEGYLGGNNEMRDMAGKTVFTANITFDEETGIGKWSEAQFKRAMRDGIRPDNTLVRYPMGPMRDLDDDDISALYSYLQAVPKIHKQKRPNESLALAVNASDGQKIYYKYGCNSCHGEHGIGVGDLRGAYKKYASDEAMLKWIRNAPSIKPDTRMPTWDGVIADNEYPPLMKYVRQLGEDAAKGGGNEGGR